MHTSTFRGATAATTLLLAVGTAATLFGQSSPTQQERPQNPTGQTPGQQGQTPGQQGQTPGQQGQQGQHGQKDFDQIANAYRQLHQVTLTTLQQEARAWKETKGTGDLKGGTGDAKGGTTGNTGGTTGNTGGTTGNTGAAAASQMTLRGDELLIAACPEGLLAGAPSGMPRTDAPKGDTRPAGTDGANPGTNPDRTAPAAGTLPEGQAVGMLLVCAHSTSGIAGTDPSTRKGENEPREASGDRDAAARNASASLMGPLKPGAYCVKQSGNSVWLTDQQGATVLRTSLDKHAALTLGDAKQDPRDTTGSGANRPADREPSVALHGGAGDWEHIFGAIAKEAMHSMGWSQQGAPASMR